MATGSADGVGHRRRRSSRSDKAPYHGWGNGANDAALRAVEHALDQLRALAGTRLGELRPELEEALSNDLLRHVDEHSTAGTHLVELALPLDILRALHALAYMPTVGEPRRWLPLAPDDPELLGGGPDDDG